MWALAGVGDKSPNIKASDSSGFGVLLFSAGMESV